LKKAQGGLNAAILIAVIAGLIILYILFLPESERKALLEDGDIGSASRSNDDKDILLQEFPERLDIIEEIEDKIIPNVFLFETTDAKELDSINPFIVRNGWFDDKGKIINFNIGDIENTDNIILTFKAKKHDGLLTIRLNNEVLYENRIESETVAPIRLNKNLLSSSNTFEFSVSSVGYKFWKTNEYSLEDIRVVGDITDKSKQESKNVFTLTGTDLFNIEEAKLRFVPYCGSVADVGVLDVSINNRDIFSGVPVCDDPYRQSIPLGILNSGENKIIFKTNKGSYSVEQIEIEFDEKEIKERVFFFEINQTTIDEVETKKKEVILTVEFVNGERNKRADLNINDRLSTIDQEERIFTKNLNSFIEEGNNFVELRPRTRMDVVEIKVVLQDR